MHEARARRLPRLAPARAGGRPGAGPGGGNLGRRPARASRRPRRSATPWATPSGAASSASPPRAGRAMLARFLLWSFGQLVKFLEHATGAGGVGSSPLLTSLPVVRHLRRAAGAAGARRRPRGRPGGVGAGGHGRASSGSSPGWCWASSSPTSWGCSPAWWRRSSPSTPPGTSGASSSSRQRPLGRPAPGRDSPARLRRHHRLRAGRGQGRLRADLPAPGVVPLRRPAVHARPGRPAVRPRPAGAGAGRAALHPLLVLLVGGPVRRGPASSRCPRRWP